MIIFWFIPQQTEKIHAQIIRLNELSIEMKVENILIKRQLAKNKMEVNIKIFNKAIIALANLANAFKEFNKLQYPNGGFASLQNNPSINKTEHIFNKNGNDKSTS